MLHRRTNTAGGSAQLSPVPPVTSPPPNTAYKPLRRGSSQLYSTPQSSQKARYSIPSPSPGLNVYTGSSPGNGYGIPTAQYGSAGVYDLNDDMSSRYDGRDDKMDWLEEVKKIVERIRRGLFDASRIDRSVSLVWGDNELRTLVLKSTLINLVSLLLLSVSPLMFSTSSGLSAAAQHTTESVGLWYNILLSWPVFVVCFWINSTWAGGISRRAQTVLHPAYRHQPPASPLSFSNTSSSVNKRDLVAKISTAIQRILLISDFTLVTHVLAFLPLIGWPLSLAYMSVIDAYYAFDPTFASKGWRLDRKVEYMQALIPYMIGFGFPATIITSFGSRLVNMAIFAVIYPFFVIQALLARPPTPRNSLLPTTPSPSSSLPESPTSLQQGSSTNPFFTPPSASSSHFSGTSSAGRWNLALDGRIVPIFVLARYALSALAWLEAALMRDRRGTRSFGKERSGKRLG